MKNVVVTGGNGYLARHLLKQLVAQGYNVTATVRNPFYAHNRNQDHIPGVKYVTADILDKESLRAAMAGQNGVFHTAAPSYFAAKNERKEFYDPICLGTRNVIELAQQCSIQKIIYTSSAHTTGTQSLGSLDESYWNTISNSAFIKAKVLGERIAWAGSQKYGLNLISILPSFMLGPGFNQLNHNSILFYKAVRGQKIYLPPFGAHFSDVRDVARAHIQAFENPNAMGRYLIAGQFLDNHALANELRKMNPKIDIRCTRPARWYLKLLCNLDSFKQHISKEKPNWSNEVIDEFIYKNQHLNTEKAEREIKWNPRPINETLEDSFEWAQSMMRASRLTSKYGYSLK